MTASLTSALSIATGGLQYSQLALGTISHNIANANTQGYSRQQVNATAVSYDGFGAGVQLQGISRITDLQLQGRVLAQQSDKTFADTMNTYYNSVSAIFNPNGTSSGLSDNINSLFSAISQLSNTPNDSALQRSVVESANLLTQNIKSASNALSDLSTRVDAQISSDISVINTALKRINDLNIQIAQQQISGNGSNANDLQDARDAQITTLATMFKLNISNDVNGAIRVSTENGRRLVDGNGYVQFERMPGATPSDPEGIGYRNVLVSGQLAPNVIAVDLNSISSGEIKALTSIRDTVIPNIKAQLDNLAQTFLLGTVNNVLSQGSSFPPVASLTSGSTGSLTNATSDILAGLGLASGSSFNLSITDSQGNVVSNAGVPMTTTISLTPTLPATTFSLEDLRDAINNSPIGTTTIGGGGGVTASTGIDANGKPYLQLTTAGGERLVLGNNTGNVLGALGMNTMFTGTGASDIAVKSSIAANPSLIPSARMRSSDGGLSSLNADNMTALAALAATTSTFGAAGGLPSVNVTASGYANAIASNLAVQTADSKSRSDFADAVFSQLTQQMGSVSGVNLNEELSQMLIFQQGFQASAHVVSVVNDLMDVLFAIRS
ncbi:MAG TPA: flagellar hook-associated protein FlgK [Alphaproteobacteria bacterium]|nr:flagellar hook-associated protein FlgK [Alphaproteobacteria bacterium]